MKLKNTTESCYDSIYKYCLVKTKKKTIAEDITQECFKIYYETNRNEEIVQPEHFLFKTAKNLCYKYFQKDKKILHTEDLNIEFKVEFNEDVIITDDDIIKFKEKILSYLSPVEYQIIKLYYEENKQVKEISALLHKSDWSIYKIKKQAEKKIKINMINLFQN